MKNVTIIGTETAKPETREELYALLSAQVEPTRRKMVASTMISMSMQKTCASLFSMKTGDLKKIWTPI